MFESVDLYVCILVLYKKQEVALASKPGETDLVAIAASGNLLELDMQRIPLPSTLCGYQSIGAKF